jgi:hypothetical protein
MLAILQLDYSHGWMLRNFKNSQLPQKDSKLNVLSIHFIALEKSFPMPYQFSQSELILTSQQWKM